MDIRRLNLESTIYLLVIILAIALRFYNLGDAALSDAEAKWALQALEVAHPGSAETPLVVGPQPAYVFLTGVVFTLFGANEFLARFWPALAGVCLIFLPLLYRRVLGRRAALILAFGLALDPGLVTVSRQAGGPMMALTFTLLAIGLWHTRRPVAAGISGGLALLCGPAFLQGALGIALTWAVLRKSINEFNLAQQEEPKRFVRRMFTAAGITFLLVGSLFLRYPQGLAAGFSALPVYLGSWMILPDFHPFELLAVLVVYQPFACIIALIAAVRWIVKRGSSGDGDAHFILIPLTWVGISLALTLLHSGRQVSELVWTLVPLWILAAFELKNYLPEGKPHPVSLMEAGLVLVLVALFWNSLIATNQVLPTAGLPWLGIRIAILLGIISLGALTTVLISLGWSWEASRFGLVWGLTLAFAAYSVSALWGATQLRPNQPQELWNQPPGTGHADMFMSTLTDLSNWNTGSPQDIQVVSTVDSPSLVWQLRGFPNYQFVSTPSMRDLPDIIITRAEDQPPALTASYRGQDFVWWTRPAWTGILPANTISWLTFRNAPILREHIILWVRADLFPGGVAEMQSSSEINELNADIK